MKIIRVDNFGREGPGHDDVLVASGITNKEAAYVMLTALRVECTADGPHYYILVDDDHVLQKFEP